MDDAHFWLFTAAAAYNRFIGGGKLRVALLVILLSGFWTIGGWFGFESFTFVLSLFWFSLGSSSSSSSRLSKTDLSSEEFSGS